MLKNVFRHIFTYTHTHKQSLCLTFTIFNFGDGRILYGPFAIHASERDLGYPSLEYVAFYASCETPSAKDTNGSMNQFL